MDILFKHYVITRFNLVDWAGYEVSYDYLNSDEYLTERFRLFELFCLPSVSSQTNGNFTWFVLFNEQLPKKWKRKMQEYQNDFPNLEIRYMTAIPEGRWQNTLNQFITNELKLLESRPQYLITTRIDNDDAIHFSFVDSIQKYFLEHQEEAIISYAKGLQYVPKYNILKIITNPKGHFGTLIEKNSSNVKTILYFPHNLPPVFPKFVCLQYKKSMWLEVIHQSNVCNTIVFQLRHLFNDLFLIGFIHKNLNDFGIKQHIPRFNFYTFLLFLKWILGKIKVKIIDKFIHK
ncbi:MAG: putative rhamnosyl transferase [Paludibacter sp.]|nr:putative rhamnosyl transferase [Paludibacter sp.]